MGRTIAPCWLPHKMHRSPEDVYLACAGPVVAAVLFGAFLAIERSDWGRHYDGSDYGVVLLELACLAGAAFSVFFGAMFCLVGFVRHSSELRMLCVLVIAVVANTVVVVVAVRSFLDPW
jgi:hypothetical protein